MIPNLPPERCAYTISADADDVVTFWVRRHGKLDSAIRFPDPGETPAGERAAEWVGLLNWIEVLNPDGKQAAAHDIRDASDIMAETEYACAIGDAELAFGRKTIIVERILAAVAHIRQLEREKLPASAVPMLTFGDGTGTVRSDTNPGERAPIDIRHVGFVVPTADAG